MQITFPPKIRLLLSIILCFYSIYAMESTEPELPKSKFKTEEIKINATVKLPIQTPDGPQPVEFIITSIPQVISHENNLYGLATVQYKHTIKSEGEREEAILFKIPQENLKSKIKLIENVNCIIFTPFLYTLLLEIHHDAHKVLIGTPFLLPTKLKNQEWQPPLLRFINWADKKLNEKMGKIVESSPKQKPTVHIAVLPIIANGTLILFGANTLKPIEDKSWRSHNSIPSKIETLVVNGEPIIISGSIFPTMIFTNPKEKKLTIPSLRNHCLLGVKDKTLFYGKVKQDENYYPPKSTFEVYKKEIKTVDDLKNIKTDPGTKITTLDIKYLHQKASFPRKITDTLPVKSTIIDNMLLLFFQKEGANHFFESVHKLDGTLFVINIEKANDVQTIENVSYEDWMINLVKDGTFLIHHKNPTFWSKYRLMNGILQEEKRYYHYYDDVKYPESLNPSTEKSETIMISPLEKLILFD